MEDGVVEISARPDPLPTDLDIVDGYCTAPPPSTMNVQVISLPDAQCRPE